MIDFDFTFTVRFVTQSLVYKRRGRIEGLRSILDTNKVGFEILL